MLQSLDLVVRHILEREAPLDIDVMIDFARRRDNAAASGALGWWLAQERHRLGVTDAALEDLRSLAPRHARYALGATSGRGRAATGWKVILPATLIEQYLDE